MNTIPDSFDNETICLINDVSQALSRFSEVEFESQAFEPHNLDNFKSGKAWIAYTANCSRKHWRLLAGQLTTCLTRLCSARVLVQYKRLNLIFSLPQTEIHVLVNNSPLSPEDVAFNAFSHLNA